MFQCAEVYLHINPMFQMLLWGTVGIMAQLQEAHGEEAS